MTHHWIDSSNPVKIRAACPDMGEHLWAYHLGENRYAVDSIPWIAPIARGDLVETDSEGVITSVLERGDRDVMGVALELRDDFPPSRVKDFTYRWARAILSHAEHGTVIVESATPGLLSLMTDDGSTTSDWITAALAAAPSSFPEYESLIDEIEHEQPIKRMVIDHISGPRFPIGDWDSVLAECGLIAGE